jgi:hypothetical protein
VGEENREELEESLLCQGREKKAESRSMDQCPFEERWRRYEENRKSKLS